MKLRILFAALAVHGCGPGGAAETVRPKDPTAVGALGEGSCESVAEGGEPLVVDWKAEQRGDLEVAMQEGVAIVSYTCEALKLLKDCHIEGNYGFIGMTKREQVVRLQNSDEVRANLPFSGGAIGGEMQRGSTLDIAMIMVGKKRTTWDEPTQADLKGSCKGATHYVRGATVGAFVLELGTEAKVKAAAELFGAGASGGSQSAKQSKNTDGNPSDCAKSTPSASKPPDQCGAPIRLVLAPVQPAPEKGKPPPERPAKPAAEVAQTEISCPKGMVLAEGKCTSPAKAPAFQCKPGNSSECSAQCDKGHAGSCGTLGEMLLSGNGIERDPAKAAPVLKKACDGDVANGCVNLGLMNENGNGVARDAAAAVKLFEKGCNAGVAFGCDRLGRAYLSGAGGVTADPAKALTLLKSGCEGGQDTACAGAAALLAEGKGGAPDLQAAAALHRRACDGTVADSCTELGRMHEIGGQGIPQSPGIAESFYRRACFRGAADACFHVGRLEFARSPDFAKRSFDMGCMRQSKLACAALVIGYGEKRPVMPDIRQTQELSRSCNFGNTRDCMLVGLLNAAANNPLGKSDLQRACMRNDRFACEMGKKLK
jgi:TPR repeat protein